MNTTQNSTKSKIVKVIGVDLAKDHCDVIGYDENGKICLRLDGCSYAKLREILSNLPQAVVLMEACKGSMFHARSIADLGHEVRLVKGADVKALRNVNHKNDLRDAAYIAKGSVRISVSGEVIPGAAQRGCPLYLRCSMPDLMR